MKLRRATVADVDLLIELRFLYFADVGEKVSDGEKRAISDQLSTYYRKHLLAGTFAAVIAEEEGGVAIGTGCLAVHEMPANRAVKTGKVGTVLNVWTHREHRRKGVGSAVIEALVEEAHSMGAAVLDLSATPAGRPLYEKCGFEERKYVSMRLPLT